MECLPTSNTILDTETYYFTSKNKISFPRKTCFELRDHKLLFCCENGVYLIM